MTLFYIAPHQQWRQYPVNHSKKYLLNVFFKPLIVSIFFVSCSPEMPDDLQTLNFGSSQFGDKNQVREQLTRLDEELDRKREKDEDLLKAYITDTNRNGLNAASPNPYERPIYETETEADFSKFDFEDCEDGNYFDTNSITTIEAEIEITKSPKAAECILASRNNYPRGSGRFAACKKPTDSWLPSKNIRPSCSSKIRIGHLTQAFNLVSLCTGVPRGDLFPMFNHESGFYENLVSSGHAVSVPQIIGPAIDDVNNNAVIRKIIDQRVTYLSNHAMTGAISGNEVNRCIELYELINTNPLAHTRAERCEVISFANRTQPAYAILYGAIYYQYIAGEMEKDLTKFSKFADQRFDRWADLWPKDWMQNWATEYPTSLTARILTQNPNFAKEATREEVKDLIKNEYIHLATLYAYNGGFGDMGRVTYQFMTWKETIDIEEGFTRVKQLLSHYWKSKIKNSQASAYVGKIANDFTLWTDSKVEGGCQL